MLSLQKVNSFATEIVYFRRFFAFVQKNFVCVYNVNFQ